MIRFEDGELLNLLPVSMANDIETQCISYALQKQVQRLLYHASRTRTVAMIDLLPETVLDVLATELRTPYYQEDMDIDTKRSIIKRTLLWHTRAGTPSAVEELIEVVFGEGSIVEWFDYDEPPYTPATFDIITNAQMTEDMAEYFLSIILRVKNTRSHIRRILVTRKMDMDERIGAGVVARPEVPVLNHYSGALSPGMAETVGAGAVSSPAETIMNSPQGRKATLNGDARMAAGAISHPREIIGNCVAPAQESAGAALHAAAAAWASTAIRILNGGTKQAAGISAMQKTAAGAAFNSEIEIQ